MAGTSKPKQNDDDPYSQHYIVILDHAALREAPGNSSEIQEGGDIDPQSRNLALW